MSAAATLLCLALSANVLDIQAGVRATLNGEGPTAADAQDALNRALGWTVVSSAGVAISGKAARVEDLDPDIPAREVGSAAPVYRFFRAAGEGPAPLRASIPLTPGMGEVEVYRRVEPGLYVRVKDRPARSGGHADVELGGPGEYVAREVDALSTPLPSEEKALLDFRPPSSAPDAKRDWKLAPEAPDLIAGPLPVILIHGQSTNRWGNFVDWASHSPEPEALAFRTRFQLWNYLHSNEGVNAAIGFSPAYPGFNESIASYLDRFITRATEEGVEVDGQRRFFSPGPFGIITHSQGGLAARVFLQNFPRYADRVFGVVTLSCPHMGTPWATPEWLRHTMGRLGFSAPNDWDLFLRGVLSEAILTGYFSTAKQSDLDMGWLNHDAVNGLGLPVAKFRAWRPWTGIVTLTLSPRDANQTLAHRLPGYDDRSFEPALQLSTYCAGLDAITPQNRGDMHLDKFFLYGGYIDSDGDWLGLVEGARKALYDEDLAAWENFGLGAAGVLMGQVLSQSTDWPLGAYRMSDGFVPLQSQLMLDGREENLIYETRQILGWRVPVYPLRLREGVVANHTLANPARVRILPGWSHLDTVIGRYDAAAKHSALFTSTAQDLLSAAPGG